MRSRLNHLSFISATLLFFLAYPLQLVEISSGISSALAQSPIGEPSVIPEGDVANPSRKAEAEQLLQKGNQQYRSSQYQEALKTYQTVLVIYKEIGDRQGEGSTLNRIGGVYQQQGQYEQALNFYQQSLAIRRELGDKAGVGRALNNIGAVYDSQGKYPQAIEFYQQALEIFKKLDNPRGVGAILSNLGLIESEIGQYSQSLELYQQSLEIWKKLGDKVGIGRTLHNVGFAYDRLNQEAKSLEFYQQALAVRREIGDKAGQGITLNNIGFVYDQLGEDAKALEFIRQALAIFQEIGNRAGVGRTLDSMGTVYKSLGKYHQALESYQQSLAIQREVGDRTGESITLGNIAGLLAKHKQPELAIFFYKQSVNITETIRRELKVLSREQQQSYTQTVADNYRSLADLLLKQNRVLEAQQVVDLLKVQELEDYLHNLRGNEQTSGGIELLPQEEKVHKDYEAIQHKAIQLGKELTQLEKIPVAQRNSTQQQRIIELRNGQTEIIKQFNEFIKTPAVVALTLQLNRTTGGENLNLRLLNKLRGNLQQLQQNAVILYPLILEDRIELVLVTPDSPPIHRTVPVKREDFNRAIVKFRGALSNRIKPTSTVKPIAQQFYNWLIKPIENDLAQAKAQIIIWAPDGQLRYIPLAALYDGKQWLVQRFSINNITALSLTDFESQPQSQPRVIAGAFAHGSYQFESGSRQFAFSGLPFAAREVETLAATIPGTTKLIDRDFSAATTLPHLNDYNIIHLATHAAFVNGQPEDSFILFGDGDRVTLRDVENWSLPNVDLVVLSACQTAVGGQLGNGEEILGFGYQMQQTGAKATIASLWSVDDGGTQTLMNAFYAALRQGKTAKAEALRSAQIALITGKLHALNQQNLEHPYYWAPFILIGNGF